jgi:hypothetical protein
MRVAEGMHIEWVDSEAVVLDPETNRLHYLNPPAALLYALILEHGFDQAIEEIKSYPSETDKTEELPRVLERMVEAGLLIDE